MKRRSWSGLFLLLLATTAHAAPTARQTERQVRAEQAQRSGDEELDEQAIQARLRRKRAEASGLVQAAAVKSSAKKPDNKQPDAKDDTKRASAKKPAAKRPDTKQPAAAPRPQLERASAKGGKSSPVPESPTREEKPSRRAPREEKPEAPPATKSAKSPTKEPQKPTKKAEAKKKEKKEKKPEPPCLAPAISITRGKEVESVALVRCDGKADPQGALRLSVLARQGSAPKPALVRKEDDLGAIKKLDDGLVERIGLIAAHFGKQGQPAPIELISGYRPSSKGSYHSHAKAMDFRVRGASNETVVAFCKTLPDTGCGYYPNSGFVHVDARPAGTGHVSWIDASGPGQPAKYVSSWPPKATGTEPAAPPQEPSEPGEPAAPAASQAAKEPSTPAAKEPSAAAPAASQAPTAPPQEPSEPAAPAASQAPAAPASSAAKPQEPAPAELPQLPPADDTI